MKSCCRTSALQAHQYRNHGPMACDFILEVTWFKNRKTRSYEVRSDARKDGRNKTRSLRERSLFRWTARHAVLSEVSLILSFFYWPKRQERKSKTIHEISRKITKSIFVVVRVVSGIVSLVPPKVTLKLGHHCFILLLAFERHIMRVLFQPD